MRDRDRLIEVLESVNRSAVSILSCDVCDRMIVALKGHKTVYMSLESRAKLEFVLAHDATSPHIRELLREGIAHLAGVAT